jgi:hypothetical protein
MSAELLSATSAVPPHRLQMSARSSEQNSTAGQSWQMSHCALSAAFISSTRSCLAASLFAECTLGAGNELQHEAFADCPQGRHWDGAARGTMRQNCCAHMHSTNTGALTWMLTRLPHDRNVTMTNNGKTRHHVVVLSCMLHPNSPSWPNPYRQVSTGTLTVQD